MCLAQGPQRNDAGEARTRDLLVFSQASTTEPLSSPNVSLSKALYPLLSAGSTQEDLSRQNRKIVDKCKESKQTKQTGCWNVHIGL